VDIKWDIAGPSGLRFFGRMTASATHELNNCLGIINENAGLLEDLVLMAQQGMEVDPERWVTISGRISSQVRRAEEITRRLNGFAHSVDSDLITVDICSLVSMAASLSKRLLAESGVVVTIEKKAEGILVPVAPFQFLHLLGRCLEFAGRHVAGPERNLRMTCHRSAAGVAVIGIFGLALDGDEVFPGVIEQALMESLAVTLRQGEGRDGLLLGIGKGDLHAGG